MKKNVQRGTYAILIFGLLVNAHFMLLYGEPTRLLWWISAAGFYIFGAIPFALTALGNRDFVNNWASHLLMLTTASVITFGGLYMQVDAFILNFDAQSGLVFAVLPAYQVVIAIISLAIANWTLDL